MPETNVFEGFDLEHFMFTIANSLEITQRHQLFSWAQGVLQGLFPHGILVCAIGDPLTRSFLIDYFSVDVVSDRQLTAICDVDHGVFLKIMRLWEKGGWRPLLVQEDAENSRRVELTSLLRESGLRNAVGHGSRHINGDLTSFFCFFRVPGVLDKKHIYLIELLNPYLHGAWVRSRLGDRSKTLSIPFPESVLTQRETEILSWIHDGKSNIEIGLKLQLSPLTVKNHVQNLLKKLNVPNRAQAVAKGLALNIIRSER